MSDCSICCYPLKTGIIYNTCCNHIFHISCIQQWVKKQTNETGTCSCPLCRSQISVFGYLLCKNMFGTEEEEIEEEEEFYLAYNYHTSDTPIKSIVY